MKKIKRALLLLFPIGIAVIIAAFLLSFYVGYEVYHDVSYGDSEANLMDIYLPNSAYKRENNGCVMFIHGGAWMGGDKREEELRCRMLASRGYIAFTVNYTLYSEENRDTYSVFSVLDELEAAFSFLKVFAAERGISIDMAATSGYSAGAHLSLLYSYSRSVGAPFDIKFAASMAGPADISDAVWGREMAATIGSLLLGTEISPDGLSGEAEALLRSVSPVSYVNGGTPPTLFIQGKRDSVVPLGNAETLEYRLMENFVSYDAIYSKKSDHSLSANPLKYLKFHKMLLKYCESYFGY